MLRGFLFGMIWVEKAETRSFAVLQTYLLVPERVRASDNDVKLVKQIFQLMLTVTEKTDKKWKPLHYQILPVNGLV